MDVMIITNGKDIETELSLAVLVLELNLLLIRMWGLRTEDWPEDLTDILEPPRQLEEVA